MTKYDQFEYRQIGDCVNVTVVCSKGHYVHVGSTDDVISVNNSKEHIDVGHVSVTTAEILVAIVLILFILMIVIGNVLVILSVVLYREMRTLSNALIVSLATADQLVALVVLPISLYYEIVGRWNLGSIICDFWITADVFCCTASILNIVVIALDRYWLISKNIKYTHNDILPRKQACKCMLFMAWGASAAISCSPLLGWKTGTERNDETVCLISQDYSYTIFSTFGAFWFPLSVILIVYMKIFCVARTRLQKRMKNRARNAAVAAEYSVAYKTQDQDVELGDRTTMMPSQQQQSERMSPNSSLTGNASKKSGRKKDEHSYNGYRKRQDKRMRRSARMLGLIIGGFMICWLPFFIVATVHPFCPHCYVPPGLASVILWLGYSNSLLNPVIYAIWDNKFRRCFQKLLCCNRKRRT